MRIVGTPLYMAPERLRGETHDGRADVYSVAVLLYEMLAGRPPYEVKGNDLIELINRQLHSSPRRLREIDPAIPEAVDRVVSAGLAKDPEARPNINQYLRLLEECFDMKLGEPSNSQEIDTTATRSDDNVEPCVYLSSLELNMTEELQIDAAVDVVTRRQVSQTVELDQQVISFLAQRERVPELMRQLIAGIDAGDAVVIAHVATDLSHLCAALSCSPLTLLFDEMKGFAERCELWAMPAMLGPLHRELLRLPQFPPPIMRLQTPNPGVSAEAGCATSAGEGLKGERGDASA